jgi:hypothetical protein
MKHSFTVERGLPRALYLHPFEALACFLEQDVQSSIATCNQLINESRTILTGQVEKYEGVGNAFYVVIGPKVVSVSCEFDDKLFCEVETPFFVQQLTLWRDFCIAAGIAS